MRRGLLLIPVALMLVAGDTCPEPPDPAKEDLKKMQGEWELKKATNQGKEDRDLDGMTMVIAKDKMTVKHKLLEKDEVATITLNGKKTPREIDMQPASKEPLVKGIYKIDKDELTICTHDRTKARPAKFDEKDADLLVFQRKKK